MLEVTLALVAGAGLGAVLTLWLTRGRSTVNAGLVALVEAVQGDRDKIVDREAAAAQLARDRADDQVRAAKETFDADRAMLMSEVHRLQSLTTRLIQKRTAEVGVTDEVPLKVPSLTPAERVAKATGDERGLDDKTKHYLALIRQGHSHENALAILEGRDEDLTPTEELDRAVEEATMRSAAIP